MQTITFTYSKDGDKVSDRVLLVLSKPSDMWKGIDITELFDSDPNKALKFVEQITELQDKFIEDAKKIQEEFDLKHNYRQFLEHKMSDIVNI